MPNKPEKVVVLVDHTLEVVMVVVMDQDKGQMEPMECMEQVVEQVVEVPFLTQEKEVLEL